MVAVALMTLLAIVVLAVERLSFRVCDHMGWLCQPKGTENLTADWGSSDFEAANPCLATQADLVAGRTYGSTCKSKRLGRMEILLRGWIA